MNVGDHFREALLEGSGGMLPRDFEIWHLMRVLGIFSGWIELSNQSFSEHSITQLWHLVIFWHFFVIDLFILLLFIVSMFKYNLEGIV